MKSSTTCSLVAGEVVQMAGGRAGEDGEEIGDVVEAGVAWEMPEARGAGLGCRKRCISCIWS